MVENRFIYLSLVFLALLSTTFVQAQHRVTGQLMDKNNNSLQGASVLLLRGDSLLAGGMSDTKGVFSIDDIPEGNYKLFFSMIGYKTVEKLLHLNASVKLGVIHLEEDIYALEDVTVTGDKRDLIEMRASGVKFQLSDKIREQAHNIFQALREIPLLSINETDRKISLADGSSPLILVNGVRRPGAEGSIDPKMVESVEIIENPSSRYLSDEGVTSVLNIKVKRSLELSQNVNVYGKQDVKASYGVYGASYQIEKANLSFYLNGQLFYFNNDDSRFISETNTGSLLRTSSASRRYDANSLYLNAGGDWVCSAKDYLSYSFTLVNNPSKTSFKGDGTQERLSGNTPFSYNGYSENDYLMGNYALFYRRSYASDRHLELTARTGHYNSSPSGWRQEKSDWGDYSNDVKMNNNRMIFSVESNYDFSLLDRVAFDLGINAYYQQVDIKELSFPFDYKEGRQYLYASMHGIGKSPFSYSLSLGLDIVERNSSGARKNFINFLPSVTFAYKLHPRGTLRLSFNRQRTSPSLSCLNPLNTSTDSLYFSEGNPYLSPELSNRVSLSFSWNKSPVYLQPSVSYTYVQDRILPVGQLHGDVYKRSYMNLSHAHLWRVGLTARLNLGEYGNINFSPFFVKQKLPGMPFSGNAWGANGNLYLSFKKLYLNGMFNYTNYKYTQLSKSHSAPMTELTLGWRLSKGWSVSVSVRDNINSYSSWTLDGDYSAYTRSDYKDRRWTPMIGLSYYFNNKVQPKYRNKKMLYNNESDSFKLEVE